MLRLGCIHQPEVHAHRILRIVRPQTERVIAKVLAGLYVVLVAIGPVERDLLSFIGNGVNTRLIDPLGVKIAVRIVPAEETVKVIVDLILQRADVYGIVSELDAQFFDLG